MILRLEKFKINGILKISKCNSALKIGETQNKPGITEKITKN